MKILGIDPGLDQTGYGVVLKEANRLSVCDAGFIKTDRTSALVDRLGIIYEQSSKLLREHEPDIVAVEELYSHYKHPKTAILMGHARGVVYLAAHSEGVPLVGYNATRIKKAVTGRGDAKKPQVAKMVDFYLGISTKDMPADLTDALGVALAHVFINERDVNMQRIAA